MQSLRQDSGAEILISNTSGKRVVTVKALFPKVLTALHLIAEHLADDEKNSQSETEVVLLLPRLQFGSIIGKAGSKIKETRQASAAFIKVSDEPLENSSEHTVTMSGTVAHVCKAIDIIVGQLMENHEKALGNTIYYQPPPRTTVRGGAGADVRGISAGGPRGGGYRERSDQIQATNMPLSIPISESIIGSIIGKGGSVINEIRRQSGATITIPERNPETNERLVAITGSFPAMTTAVRLIGQKISSIQKFESRDSY